MIGLVRWIVLTCAVVVALVARPGAAGADDAGVAPAPVIVVDAGVTPPPVVIVDAGPTPAPVIVVDAGPTPAPVIVVDAGPTPAPVIVVDAGPTPATITTPTPAPTAPRGDRAMTVIKLVLGLSAVFVLAYLGGHRRVVALEARLGISGVIAAGFPMIALGVIVRQPEIGILTDDVLERMQPILHFGLGWLGFIIGAQLDIRLLDRVPRGTGYLIVVEALGPFALTAVACAGLAFTLDLSDWHQPEFWRDAIVLGAAAAMTAPRRFRGFASRGWREGKGVDHLIAQLDEIVGVVGLLFVAAYFRPAEVSDWQIPGTAWLFVAIGLGVVVGLLIFAMIRVPTTSGEFLAVVLGSVAFGAGLAGYLDLSPTVVCFIAGALVTNFPNDQRGEVFRILNHLERPIHLLFLVLAGATWDVTATAPWLVVPGFVVARVVGKWLAVSFAHSTVGAALPTSFVDDRTLISPLSPLAIALVLSLQGSAGGTPSPWLLTVVIGGALLTELAVALTAAPVARGGAAGPPGDGGPTPVDELDEPAPIYHDDAPDDDLPPPGGAPPAPPPGAGS